MRKTIYIVIICLGFIHWADAQCFPDRHSTNFYDGWVSCETALNPNPERGKGHFIMYDFGKTFALGQMRIWNSNDPAHLDWGMRDVVIDYSTDGVNWTHATDFTIPQASGLSTYEGVLGPDLNNIEARYLLISAVNNYGGECFGIAEIQVAGEEVIISDVDIVNELTCADVTLYPNPFADKLALTLAPVCSGELLYTIYDASGKAIDTQKSMLDPGRRMTMEIGAGLPSGSYRLKIQFGGQTIQRTIIKV